MFLPFCFCRLPQIPFDAFWFIVIFIALLIATHHGQVAFSRGREKEKKERERKEKCKTLNIKPVNVLRFMLFVCCKNA